MMNAEESLGTDPVAPATPAVGTPPPQPLSDFDLYNLVEPEARKNGIDPDLILRQIRQESGGKPWKVSPKGAQGLMQLMPATALSYGVKDPFDPQQNITAGIAHMAKLLKKHQGDQRKALLEYNGGAAAVQAFQAGHPFKESTGYLAGIQPQAGGPPPVVPSGPPPPVAPPSTGAPPGSPAGSAMDPQMAAQAKPVQAQMSAAHVAAQTTPPTPGSAADFDTFNAQDDFDTFNTKVADPNYQDPAAAAATGATRLTPGYGPVVEFLRALPATAGSFAGMLSKRTGPVGAVIGSGLAATGAAIGETAMAGGEKLASMAGLTDVPPPTWEGYKSRVEEAATAAAFGEGMGRGLNWVGGKFMAPFAGSVDAEGQAVRKMFPNALPNQVADSPILNTATAVAEHAPLTGSRVAERRALLSKAAQDKATAILRQYGQEITPESAGKIFQDALEHNTEAFKSEGGKLYRKVDEAGQGVTVPLDSLQEYATQELERRGGVPGEVSGNRGLRMLKQVAAAGAKDEAGNPEADALVQSNLKQVADSMKVSLKEFMANPKFAALRERFGGGTALEDTPMAKEMTFEQAASYRSDLMSFIRHATHEKDDVARGTAQQLLKRLDAAMDEAGAASGVKDLYRQANEFWKVGKEKYESELMRGLAEKYPEKVAKELVTAGATTPIREARAAVGPVGWQGVQRHVAQSILEAATSADGKSIAGDKLLGKLRELSKPTLQEVFPKDHANDLWTLGTILDRTQRSVGGKSGTMGIYLGQGGVIAGAMKLHFPKTAGLILITPNLLGRLMTNPTGAKWLSVGLTAPRGSKLAAQAAIKLAAQLAVDRDQGQDASVPPPSPQVGQPPPKP